jgi:acyl dehydratase
MVITGFEQYAVGQVFKSGSQKVDAAEIKSFARQFDGQPQHIDEETARGSIFGTLVASGWHTASLTMRLLLESALAGVGGRSMGVRMNDLAWSAPVYPGDSLHAVSEVTELRPSRSKPDRGLVTFRTITRNQDGAAVQEMLSTVMILRSDAVIQA